jgi:hypothetical protein
MGARKIEPQKAQKRQKWNCREAEKGKEVLTTEYAENAEGEKAKSCVVIWPTNLKNRTERIMNEP